MRAGTRLGVYNLGTLLGQGGMGEVYKAHDTRLNRDVALKVLPAGLAGDPDRLARFRREAQVLASLNHPNVGQIYGFEEGTPVEATGQPAPGGITHALVLELVNGPTLADRIAQGSIEMAEALVIARQIALALAAAHERGIVHRDLKPANVKVQSDGLVKVLDFGLAKALEPSGATGADADNSPTLTNRATAVGVILGTAAYMSPEQAKGKVVDQRADIWSFGVVLYEMLTGRRLFRGADVPDTLAEILKSDPDWTALPPSTPASIRRLLRRCLQRDRQERLHDISDARLEIDDAIGNVDTSPVPAPDARPAMGRERWLWALALAVALIALVTVVSRLPVAPREAEMRVELVTPPFGGLSGTALALSPDGRSVAFVGNSDGQLRVWTRDLDADQPRAYPGTEGAAFVTWSDDGRSLLFARLGAFYEIDAGGGTPHARPDLLGAFGLTWNREGVVLFVPANGTAVTRKSGSEPSTPATRLVPPQVGHRFPYFLPDGKHFVFLVAGPPGVQGLYLGTLDSLDARRLLAADTRAVFLPPDYIVFGLADVLYAQRMNLQTWEPIDKPVFIADQPLQDRTVFGSVALATSRSGTLAYRRFVAPRHQLSWLDRTGRVIGTIGDVDTAEFLSPPRLSPDGRTVALVRRVNGATDVWTIDNSPHGVLQRFASDPGAALGPIWSADGRRIAYQSSRKGGGFYDLYAKSFGDNGAESALIESTDNKTLTDWSRDDKFVLMAVQFHQEVQRDLWALPLSGDRQPFSVAATPGDEIAGRFSPDSRWVTYQSTEAGGGPEIYVRPFPGPGRDWRISNGGGVQPEWGKDGRELFYISNDSHVMAVPLTLAADGTRVERGAPVPLFVLAAGSTYSVAPDGQRFLVNLALEQLQTSPINLIFNWAGPKK